MLKTFTGIPNVNTLYIIVPSYFCGQTLDNTKRKVDFASISDYLIWINILLKTQS